MTDWILDDASEEMTSNDRIKGIYIILILINKTSTIILNIIGIFLDPPSQSYYLKSPSTFSDFNPPSTYFYPSPPSMSFYPNPPSISSYVTPSFNPSCPNPPPILSPPSNPIPPFNPNPLIYNPSLHPFIILHIFQPPHISL